MLEDRSYMRQPSFGVYRSATIVLVAVNVVAFIIQLLLLKFWGTATIAYLALSQEGLRHGFVWQLITFQFMHASFWHLFFNGLAIFMFGRFVENALGRKNFLILYFAGGVIGGIFQVLAGLFLKGIFAGPVVGASAGAFGVIAAFSLLFPDELILLFFVLPMRAKYFLWLAIAIAVFGIIFPTRGIFGNVADAAHLGGILTGILFVRYGVNWQWHLPQFRKKQTQPMRRLVKVPSQKPGGWGRGKDDIDEDLPPQEFLSKEVDPILEKISAQGIQSLTEREKQILEKARGKVGKR